MYVTLDIGISATAVKSNRGEGTMKRGGREKNKWFKQESYDSLWKQRHTILVFAHGNFLLKFLNFLINVLILLG